MSITLSNLNELGAIIDRACDISNIEELNTIIAIHSEFTDNLDDSIEKTYSYYLLGNAYNGIRKIEHEKNVAKIWRLEQEEVLRRFIILEKLFNKKTLKI